LFVRNGGLLEFLLNMGITIFTVENTILKKTKKTAKKKSQNKVSLDFFKIALADLPERTVLDDSYGKGVVKGNTVGRMQDYLNQSKE